MGGLTLFEKLQFWFHFVLPTFFCRHRIVILSTKYCDLDGFGTYHAMCKKCGKSFYINIPDIDKGCK